MEDIALGRKCLGKTLAEDVFDSRGRRLLSAGTLLNDKQLEILKSRGISKITVENSENNETTTECSKTSDLEEFPDFFALWDASAIPEGMKHMAVRQYTKSHFDSFLPVQGDINPSDFVLKVTPLEEIIRTGNLFTLPEVYYHISKVISSPLSSASEIGDAIKKDPSFTTKLLQLANSSLYGSSGKISSITQAVSVIGINQLAMLSVGIAFTRSFQSSVLEASTMQNFWKHSIATGIAAMYLAEKTGYKNTEIFFIAGLLHDIGKILEYSAIMDSAYILHSLAYLTKRQQQEIEKELLSFDHAEIGGAYIEENNLPSDLKDMIKYHHNPDKARNKKQAAIIHLADILINTLKVGSSGQYYIPPINTSHSTLLKNNLSEHETIERVVNSYTSEMMDILLIG